MKLSTLKAAERAALRLVKAFEAEAKYDNAAKELRETYGKLWMERYNAWKNAAVAAAARKDKGEVLFTIFIPRSHSLRVETRTPHLLTTQYFYKESYSPTGYRPSAPHVDISNNSYWNADYDFKRLMIKEAA